MFEKDRRILILENELEIQKEAFRRLAEQSSLAKLEVVDSNPQVGAGTCLEKPAKVEKKQTEKQEEEKCVYARLSERALAGKLGSATSSLPAKAPDGSSTQERAAFEQATFPLPSEVALREAEKLEIEKLDDQVSRDLLSANSGDEQLALVHSAWLYRWRKWAHGTGARPGPITNFEIMEINERTPKPALAKYKDYRALHPTVFRRLREIYGGGPAILRTQLDIYQYCNQEPAASAKPLSEKDKAFLALLRRKL
eukprot:gb/GEZN01010647.1/.p1 GENE.gb/GEZN01010647.1/~~gb/GEZN01010647.1/.p1  ORF type:complete len:254 (-),score=44.46 gb/GEZN01010647.1/:259-1020(-)